jgi:hypothetical protein
MVLSFEFALINVVKVYGKLYELNLEIISAGGLFATNDFTRRITLELLSINLINNL